MKASLLLVMVIPMLTRSETTEADAEAHPNETQSPQVQILKASNLFANEMYKVLSEKQGNMLFSPLSAHALLAMMYQGMSGEIKDTFARILHLPEIPVTADGYSGLMDVLSNDTNQEVACLNIANKIFIDSLKSLNPAYKEIVEKKFSSEIESIRFANATAAAGIINDWAKNKSMGKIKELFTVEELEGAVIVLANSVYFKSSWYYKFKGNITTEFYPNNQTVMNVSMMVETLSILYKNDVDLDAKIIDIPYSNEGFSMLIFLPNNKDGIDELANKLLEVEVNKVVEGMKKQSVTAIIPKFKFKETVQLIDVLRKMGLGDLFKSGKHLSGIVENGEDLYVSGAIQKVFIQVDKSGTEAAVITAVRGRQRSRSKSKTPVEFKADHPFIFMLTHQEPEGTSGLRNILFYGRVVEPTF